MLKQKSKNLKFLIIIITLGLVLPSFSFAQQAPGTMDEAKTMGGNIISQLPGTIKKVWQEEAWPFFKNFFQKLWEWIWPKIEPWWQRKKPVLEQELQKETQEMKEDLPNLQKVGKPLWERFKELIK